MKNTIEKRYDQLKINDVIYMYGAKERIADISTNEQDTYFTVEPYDHEAVEILGSFYSHGTYGGINSLTATVIEE